MFAKLKTRVTLLRREIGFWVALFGGIVSTIGFMSFIQRLTNLHLVDLLSEILVFWRSYVYLAIDLITKPFHFEMSPPFKDSAVVSSFICGAYVRSRQSMQHEDSKVRVVMTTVVLFTWCLFQFHYLLNVQDASSVFFWFALTLRFTSLVLLILT
jgi:hypothetical protein